MKAKVNKIKKSERTIMFLLFDNARSKEVSLRFWVDYILKTNDILLTMENKISVQKYLASNEVYDLILPKIKYMNIYKLASELFNDKDLKKELAKQYMIWRANNGSV